MLFRKILSAILCIISYYFLLTQVKKNSRCPLCKKHYGTGGDQKEKKPPNYGNYSGWDRNVNWVGYSK